MKKTIFHRATDVYRKKGIIGLMSSGSAKARNRLAKKFPHLTTPPLTSVAIEPTNSCNLRCKMCYSQRPQLFKPREQGFMDWGMYTKIIDELSEIKSVNSIGLNFGGESLLHKKFTDMLDYAAAKKKFSIGFHTNGMLLTKDMAERLVADGIDRVTISMDGLREKNEAIRVGANYDTILENIRNLMCMRKNGKPQVGVNLTMSEHSKDDIDEFINTWVNIVDEVIINPLSSEDSRILSDQEFFDREVSNVDHCQNMFYYIAILWNGDVTTCCNDIAGINVMGNVKKMHIMDIWKSKEFVDLRRASIANKFRRGTLCHTCEFWKKRFVAYEKVDDHIQVEYSGLSKSYRRLRDDIKK